MLRAVQALIVVINNNEAVDLFAGCLREEHMLHTVGQTETGSKSRRSYPQVEPVLFQFSNTTFGAL